MTLTAAAFTIGVTGAWGVAALATRVVPEFVTRFQVRDIATVLVVTVIMAVLASIVPVRRLNGIDPASVFRA